MTPTRTSRAAACLLGQALGDASGFVVEGLSAAECRAWTDTALRSGSAPPVGRPPFPFGQYSDDTQLAREFLRSVVACDGFDAQDFGDRVADIFVSGRIVGRGRATEQAAFRIADGVPALEAGTPAPSAGNGSAMRAGAVGLPRYADRDALIRVARQQSLVTHSDPRCVAGSVAVALGVWLGLGEAPPSIEAVPALIERAMRDLDCPVMADGFASMPRWLQQQPEDAAAAIAPFGKTIVDPWPGISPFVVGSVLWSFQCFMRHPAEPWQAIRAAIAAGGDVDTTAAMTGALAGAWCGLGELPEARRAVNDRGTWGHDDLIDLAERAARVPIPS